MVDPAVAAMLSRAGVVSVLVCSRCWTIDDYNFMLSYRELRTTWGHASEREELHVKSGPRGLAEGLLLGIPQESGNSGSLRSVLRGGYNLSELLARASLRSRHRR